MGDEMTGTIFDFEIVPTVDMSDIDKLEKELNEIQAKKVDIQLNPQWQSSPQEIIDNFKNSNIKIGFELDVPKNLNRTITNLKRLSDVMKELSNGGGNGSLTQGANVVSNNKLPDTKTLKNDIEGLVSNVRGYINAIDEIYRITDGLRVVEGQDIDSIKNDINDINKNINNAVGYYEEILSYDPELFKNKKAFKGIDGLANIWNSSKEKYADSVYTAVKDIIEEAYELMEDAINSSTDESLKGALERGVISQKLFNIPTPKSKTVPVTSTIGSTSNLDINSLTNAMSISFDDSSSKEIKSDTKIIQRDVAAIKNTLMTGIPVTGNIPSDSSNGKPQNEKFKLDATELIKAINNLSTILEKKKAIVEQEEKNASIIKSDKGSVTAKQVVSAIADSERRVDSQLAKSQTMTNAVYNKTKKLVETLQKENEDIYKNLGKNFLDIPEKELNSFKEAFDSITDKTVKIDVDIPNIENVKGLLLTLHKLEKAEKKSDKEAKAKAPKSKTKAVEPAIASKGGSTSDEPNSVTLPKNLNITNEEGNKLLGEINDNVKTISDKLDGKGKTSTPKTRTKKSDNDGSTGLPSAVLKSLSDSFASFGDSIKQIESGVDLILEESNEVASNTKGTNILLNSIYGKISSGITVTGSTPAPATNNTPTPTPQPNSGGTPRNKGGNNPKPTNTPVVPTRNREDMLKEATHLLPAIEADISKIRYLLNATGGVSDTILSEDDAEDLLDRLEEVRDKLLNVKDVTEDKRASQKKLATAESNLVDASSLYSNTNIPQEVYDYSSIFNNNESIKRAERMLFALERLRNDLEIKGVVDTSAYDNAIQRLEDGIERINKTRESWMSQKWDNSGLRLASYAMDQVRDSLDEISDKTESFAKQADDKHKEIFSFDEQIREIKELESSLISLDKLIKDAKSKGVDISSVGMKNGQTLADAEETIKRYFSEKDSLGKYTSVKFADESEFEDYKNEIITDLIEPTKIYATTLGETRYAVNQLIQEQKELTKASNEYNKGLTLNKQISNKITELEKWRDANSKAFAIPENAAEYERFMNRLKDGTIIDQSQMKKFNAEWAEFNAQIRAAGQNGKTTGSILTAMFKKFGGWTLVTRTITQGIRLMKDMVTQVKEVDTAMVNLRKVTDASEQSLLKYQKSVQKSSIALGTTLTDQIDSTAIFSRLGYQLEEAQKLGEIASKYKTVAEDLDINTASESIISTMKAYQSMGDTAEEIVDKFNYVGNNFAVSSSGLGESLQRSASSLVAANNTLSEAIALTTAGNEIIQDPEKMGTSLKTISARIRGAKSELEEEGEEMTMTVSKLRDEIKSISGVEIMLDEHSFRSTYDILNDLSKVWKDLNDTDQARIGEMLGGKVGINTVYAMLENFETARDVVKELNEGMAEGSADRELETALDSIQGKLNQIQSVWQTLSTNVVDSELVKDGLDWVVKFGEGLNDILDVLKDMKGLGTGLLAFGGMTALQAQLKNKTGSGRVKMFALDKYARVSSGGNTERVRTVLVCGKRALEKLPKLAHCVTSFMNLVREGWLRYRLIRSQAYLVGRFREYNGRAARVVMGYSRQLRERSKIIRSDSLLRWKKAINIV